MFHCIFTLGAILLRWARCLLRISIIDRASTRLLQLFNLLMIFKLPGTHGAATILENSSQYEFHLFIRIDTMFGRFKTPSLICSSYFKATEYLLSNRYYWNKFTCIKKKAKIWEQHPRSLTLWKQHSFSLVSSYTYCTEVLNTYQFKLSKWFNLASTDSFDEWTETSKLKILFAKKCETNFKNRIEILRKMNCWI